MDTLLQLLHSSRLSRSSALSLIYVTHVQHSSAMFVSTPNGALAPGIAPSPPRSPTLPASPAPSAWRLLASRRVRGRGRAAYGPAPPQSSAWQLGSVYALWGVGSRPRRLGFMSSSAWLRGSVRAVSEYLTGTPNPAALRASSKSRGEFRV